MSTSGPITTAAEAGAWLEGLINFERRPGFSYSRLGLEPIRRLLARLDAPDAGLSILHVAGSKGKGSTCLLAEAVLGAAGERVGTFTSPHLERWTERFRIGGQEVDEAALAAAVEAVRPHVEELRSSDPANAPTFFDATTATALLVFARAGVDRVVLEVGLGGRLDSTNAVQPAVTVVTQIELEHTDKLGDTLAEIAGEKAGILKPDVPAVVGALAPEALEVVLARADAVGAPVSLLGRDFEAVPTPSDASDALARQRFTFAESGEPPVAFELGVLGRHQIDNAALALAAVRRLAALPPAELAAAAQKGLAEARLPGRLEVASTRPLVLIDAAHTESSARSLGAVLDRFTGRRRHLVLSLSQDKDPAAVLGALVSRGDTLWLTRAEPIRSIDPSALAERLRDRVAEGAIHCVEDPVAAVRAARAAVGPDDLLCCTGSVYLAGAARRAIRPASDTGID